MIIQTTQSSETVSSSSTISPRPEKGTVSTSLNECAFEALKQLSQAYAVAAKRPGLELQRTQGSMQLVLPELKQRFVALCEENTKLREELSVVTTEFISMTSQIKQLEMAHQAVVDALKAKAQMAEELAKEVQAKKEAAIRKAQESVDAAIADKAASVKAVTDAGNARIESTQKDVSTLCYTQYQTEIDKINTHYQSEIHKINTAHQSKMKSEFERAQTDNRHKIQALLAQHKAEFQAAYDALKQVDDECDRESRSPEAAYLTGPQGSDAARVRVRFRHVLDFLQKQSQK